MKILISADSYYPRVGGAEVYAFKLATFLIKNGHKVTVITTEPGTWEGDKLFSVVRIQLTKNPLVTLPALWTYARLVASHDIVHAIYSHKLATFGGIFARLTGRKLVIAEQGRGILDLPGNSFFYASVHELYRAVSIWCSSLFIASCREFVSIAGRYTTPDKIVYQPNSVDTDEFMPESPDYSLLPFAYNGQPLVFIIRRMVPKNGVQFLVDAAPYIFEAIPNARIVHIGWGLLEEHLKNKVKELGITDQFYFLGRIENAVLRRYLSLADVVVFPSTAEATSIACLEAMSMGKPIVASRVGGFPEMVREGWNGILVSLTDTEHSDYGAPLTLSEDKLRALANAVTTVIGNPKKAKVLGQHSRQRAVEEFSWKRNVLQIIKWYKVLYERR